MDHVKHLQKAGVKQFIYPPAPPTKEELEVFGPDLGETIQEKIKLLLLRADELELERAERLDNLARIHRRDHLKDFDLWFWSYWAEVIFSEYYLIQKWLRYWMDISHQITGRKPVIVDQFNEKGVSREEIEQAKRYPLERLFQGQLQHNTNRLLGKCPFHKEDSPSFVIYEDKNTFYCFGCNAWGDPIDYVMKSENLSLVEAVKKLI